DPSPSRRARNWSLPPTSGTRRGSPCCGTTPRRRLLPPPRPAPLPDPGRNRAAPPPPRRAARRSCLTIGDRIDRRLRPNGSSSPERDRAQRRGVLARAGEHVIDVRAGDHETGAEADQLALKRDIVADAADPERLAVGSARG